MAEDRLSSSSDLTSKQQKERGPYNQYLSQPQAKIPRTTLKRWPKNTSTLLDFTQTARLDKPSHQCESAVPVFSIEDGDNVCAFDNEKECHMSNIRTLEAYLCEVSAPLADESSNKFVDFNEIDPEWGTFDGKSAESEDDASAYNFENVEVESEYYMDNFNTEKCAGESNKEANTEKVFADVPLYSGAPISVAVSMLLIITFVIRHSLTGVALVDLLTLVSLHCSVPNECASSIALLKKFFMKLKNPIQYHYYCTYCMEYQGLSIAEDNQCTNKHCLKDLRTKGNCSHFIIIPLMCQLMDFFKSKCVGLS